MGVARHYIFILSHPKSITEHPLFVFWSFDPYITLGIDIPATLLARAALIMGIPEYRASIEKNGLLLPFLAMLRIDVQPYQMARVCAWRRHRLGDRRPSRMVGWRQWCLNDVDVSWEEKTEHQQGKAQPTHSFFSLSPRKPQENVRRDTQEKSSECKITPESNESEDYEGG
jgi:hypothetical protein